MFVDKSIKDFVNETASKAPIPGGGGVSALVGALGIALGDMVGELTVGKKKYAHVEEDIKKLMTEAETLKDKLLRLVDADAEAFLPLSKAYGIPKDEPGRDEIMEEALRKAAAVPMDIIRSLGKAMEIIEDFSLKGSRLAISDAGCAAVLCSSAMRAAALNVYINSKSMMDREYALSLNTEVNSMLDKYIKKAEKIYSSVEEALK